MLLFIFLGIVGWNPESEFQYISCCYLSEKSRMKISVSSTVSIHLMLLFIGVEIYQARRFFISFNTSHVVIYPFPEEYLNKGYVFQYISCCYLSYSNMTINRKGMKFQYISCCYLSWKYRYSWQC